MRLYYIMEDDKMNKDLILAIEALEKENGISKEVMFDAIEKSLRMSIRQSLTRQITEEFHLTE